MDSEWEWWDAIRKGELEKVSYLIKNSKIDINQSNGTAEWTPLDHASLRKRAPLVKLLLENGADPNKALSSLYFAVENNQVEIVNLLLEHGVNPNQSTPTAKIIPLDYVAFMGYEDIARGLLDHGANVNLRDAEDSWTALHTAANNGHLAVARLLLEHGADWQLRTSEKTRLWFLKDALGKTPLELARMTHNDHVAKLLEEWPTTRVHMRLAFFMGCHPRVGANSSLNRLGHLLLRQIIQNYIYPVR